MNMAHTVRWHLFLVSLLTSAYSAKYDVVWTKDGVADLNHKIRVRSGDSLRFICPIGSYSTIWYMVSQAQYESCDCGVDTCLRPAFCPGLIQYSYTVDIERNSEQLENAQDYQPGTTYYFASFSTGSISSIDRDNGGECESEELRLEIEVLPADGNTGGGDPGNTDGDKDTTPNDDFTPGDMGGDGEKEDEEEGSGSANTPDLTDALSLTPSSSHSSATTLSSILICTLLALLIRH